MRSNRPGRFCSLAATAALLSAAGTAWAETPETRWEQVVGLDDASVDLIPLTHVAVRGQITGNLAVVEVEQTFDNLLGERMEAVYVFPLPDDAAVHDMVMIVGERRIVADLRERQEARETYERARAVGHTTSLVEQERPNIFTTSVANIRPGEPIRVLIRYVEELPYRDGRYQFHFPTTVGPRFIPGTPWSRIGDGVLPDTDIVPDASRITPAVLPEGVPTPYEVDLQLEVETPMPMRDLESPSHALVVTQRSDHQALVTLPEDGRQPDRDIVLSFALAGQEPEIGIMSHHDPERGKFFSLMIQPPLSFERQQIRPRELVFVLDTSGSMAGYPMEASKEVMRHALRHLNPSDTFQIIRFSNASSSLSPIPLASTPANVRRGLRFIDALSGSGGTNMTEGIRAALEPRSDPSRMRIVLFLTDGYIGNEADVLALIDRHLGQSRLFSLGVGSAVNRSLLNRMADRGRGAVQIVTTGEPIPEVVESFYRRFRAPILTDITIDWGDLDVTEVVPARIPDVFAGAPITVSGRFAHGGHGTIVVRGRYGRVPVELPFLASLEANGRARPAVPALWARRQVDAIERQYDAQSDLARARILPLALRYGLLTRFTSFVAVEERVTADVADPLRTVGVPVALPAGVSRALLGPQVLPAVRSRPTASRSASASTGTAGVHARGLLRASVSVPTIRTGTAMVRGSLSKTVISRQLRLQRNSIRGCYERALIPRPDLEGRIAVRFVISASGAVASAQVAGSTIESPELEQCVLETIRQISFPIVEGGGVVIVTYPFLFMPRPPDEMP